MDHPDVHDAFFSRIGARLRTDRRAVACVYGAADHAE
jgi:hypothetical protein